MDFTPTDIEALVLKKFNQDTGDCIEGPQRVGGYEMTRVWTYDDHDEEYHAHYAVRSGEEVTIFQDFAPFANWLSTEFDLENVTERYLRVFRTRVAAFVTLVAMAIVAFVVFRDPSQSFPVAYVMSAVVGGAATFLFGAMRPKSKSQQPKIPTIDMKS